MTAQVGPVVWSGGVLTQGHNGLRWDMLQEVSGKGLMEASLPQHLKGKIAGNVRERQIFCTQDELLAASA